MLVTKNNMDITSHYKMEKKAISGVIAAVLMIALVMASISIVWVVVNNIVEDKLSEAGSCFDVFDKIEIDDRYTCYTMKEDGSDSEGKTIYVPNELNFSISVGDIDVQEILVSISSSGKAESFNLKPGFTDPNVKSYGNNYGDQINFPGKNSGQTYSFNLDRVDMGKPTSIQIAPIIGGNTCEVADSLQFIDNCLALVD